jgi:hypothetical protein
MVMECVLGRLLERHEVVHHRNGQKTDNRPDNLELLPDSRAHGLHHREEHSARERAPLDEAQVQQALQAMTTAQAAAHLGVTHMTLRRWLPHLIRKRKTPGGQYPTDLVDAVRWLAERMEYTAVMAPILLNVSPLKFRAIRRTHDIDWPQRPQGAPSRKPSAVCAQLQQSFHARFPQFAKRT